jgi:hypothetical protein
MVDEGGGQLMKEFEPKASVAKKAKAIVPSSSPTTGATSATLICVMNYPKKRSAALRLKLHLKKAEEEALNIQQLHDQHPSLACKILHPTSIKDLRKELRS